MAPKFPFNHIVQHENKEVLVVCQSSITAMGIPALVAGYFPGYTAKIISPEYYRKLSKG
jgi:hypothetical protein